jgi:hypothetical protein
MKMKLLVAAAATVVASSAMAQSASTGFVTMTISRSTGYRPSCHSHSHGFCHRHPA